VRRLSEEGWSEGKAVGPDSPGVLEEVEEEDSTREEAGAGDAGEAAPGECRHVPPHVLRRTMDEMFSGVTPKDRPSAA
jgi:hypothetical protein